jgi:hypothetical protein
MNWRRKSMANRKPLQLEPVEWAIIVGVVIAGIFAYLNYF